MEEEPQEPQEEPSSPLIKILASLLVDGALQIPLTFWLNWILLSLFHNSFNLILFWAGATMVYVLLHYYAPRASGVVLVKQFTILIVSTIYIWISGSRYDN